MGVRKIIVHGVHRSGTSLTASLLAKAGLWYAEEQHQMEGQADNLKGFWERKDVVDLNDSILASENINWFTLTPEISSQAYEKMDSRFGLQIEEVAQQLEKYDNWFLKDPRLSITWPLWRRYLSPTHHIIVNRHPVSVAKSLYDRNKISIEQGLIFWYHQTRMIASALSGSDNVYNLEFGSKEYAGDAAVGVVNTILDGNESQLKLEQEQFDSVFAPELISHNEIDNSLLDSNSVISSAWTLAKLGKFDELLVLPEIQPSQLTWQDLDSKNAFASQLVKSERELLQHQEEIVSYSDRLIEKNSQTNLLQEKLRNKKDEIKHLEGETNRLEGVVKGLQKTVTNVRGQLAVATEQADESKLSLLKIAGELNGFMMSKRYMIIAIIGKAMSKFRLIQNRTLHTAFDIAKFGHAPSALEQVLPVPSNRTLLLKAIIRNPGSFLKRLSVKRLVKGTKMLLGKEEVDIGVSQALTQYSNADFPNDSNLEIFSPENYAEWAETAIEFKTPDKPKVSIVIPVYNNYLTTLACLYSIHKHTNPLEASFEIVIADDFSTDQTNNIEDIVGGVRVVRGDSNLGFLRNCNQAIPKARGEYVVLLNNDTNVQRGWLTELIKPFEKEADIGVTGPMFVYPDGRLQEAGGIIFSDASGWNYGRLDRTDKPEYNYARNVDYVSGACLVFQRSLWNDVGGFDERFTPAYYEDTDFCFEARKQGLHVRFVPTSKVVHFEGVSHGSDENSGVKKYQTFNKDKFEKKWRRELAKQHYQGAENLFSARIHGREKKTLLFIDHYVPFYDKDAGSKVAKRYIELLVEQGIHVIFLGDNFYPHQPYTEDLQALGVEVLYGEFYKNHWYQWLTENASSIDSVYLNRPHISENYIDKLRALESVPFIAYHGADLHYLRVSREEALGITSNEGRTADEWKAVEYELMRKCDVSLWLSDLEVSEINAEDPSIRSVYKPMYWFEPEDLYKQRHVIEDKNLLFVGGFGHPPNLDGLEWFLQEVYPDVIKAHPDVSLIVIGSNCPRSIQELQGKHIEILGYVTEAELEAAYKRSRISIVPLRYGAGVKGKVIESMKFGVPVMTTAIGAEGLPGSPNTYLSVQNEAKGFAEQLNLLLDQDELCMRNIKLSDDALLEHFSKDAAIKAISVIMGET